MNFYTYETGTWDDYSLTEGRVVHHVLPNLRAYQSYVSFVNSCEVFLNKAELQQLIGELQGICDGLVDTTNHPSSEKDILSHISPIVDCDDGFELFDDCLDEPAQTS